MELASHIQFQTDTNTDPTGGDLSGGDYFTISNPSYGPSGTTVSPVPGFNIIYDNNTFNLTTSSVITVTAANPISIINFQIY